MEEKNGVKKSSPIGIYFVLGVIIFVQFVALVYFSSMVAPEDKQVTQNSTNVVFTGSGDESIINNTQQLKKFDSEDALRSFLNSVSADSGSDDGYGSGSTRGLSLENSMADSVEYAVASGGSAEKSVAQDYSETNIQVEGVDEADFVKNDGKYIYIISDNKLVIVSAYPGDYMSIVSETKVNEGSSAQDMFIYEDKLVLLNRVSKERLAVSQYNFMPTKRYDTYTQIVVYDISSKENPKVMETYEVDGNYNQARLIGNNVYLISRDDVYWRNDIVMPAIWRGDTKIMSPEIYYFDNKEDNYRFNTVSALDLDSLEINAKTFMLGYSNTVYFSEDNIYIAYRKGYNHWWFGYRGFDRNNIEVLEEVVLPVIPTKYAKEIEGLDKESLKNVEYVEKVVSILESMYSDMDEKEIASLRDKIDEKYEEYNIKLQEENAKTVIQKINVDDLEIEYVAKGEVKGYLLNQFSMDEYEGNFRVATTYNIWVGDRSELYNNVYVLDENLNQIGEIEKIAPDENIYSTRFMGDKLYMVTYERIDPLFTIDLSDPKNPEIMGELKIPGFSNYLHPYGDDYIIGVGKHTYEENDRVVTKGVKISLFDVSDFENPKEVDYVTIGDSGSYSEVDNDHKALLFDEKRGVLVVPVLEVDENYDYDSEGYYRNNRYNRAYVFDVSGAGFDEKGFVEHEVDDSSSYYNRYRSTIKRSLYMDDYLYTISQNYIKSNDINTLEDLDTIEFEIEEPKYIERDYVY